MAVFRLPFRFEAKMMAVFRLPFCFEAKMMAVFRFFFILFLLRSIFVSLQILRFASMRNKQNKHRSEKKFASVSLHFASKRKWRRTLVQIRGDSQLDFPYLCWTYVHQAYFIPAKSSHQRPMPRVYFNSLWKNNTNTIVQTCPSTSVYLCIFQSCLRERIWLVWLAVSVDWAVRLASWAQVQRVPLVVDSSVAPSRYYDNDCLYMFVHIFIHRLLEWDSMYLALALAVINRSVFLIVAWSKSALCLNK